jgi:uncharacterized protein YggT (Ycf19 family)
MDEATVRLAAFVRLVLPFLFFMAAFYLALHIVFARLVPASRPSATLWFFTVLTGPLTRPVRALLPPGTPDTRVRAVSLGVYVGLWIVARLVVGQLFPAPG